jgi:hypothetical protein
MEYDIIPAIVAEVPVIVNRGFSTSHYSRLGYVATWCDPKWNRFFTDFKVVEAKKHKNMKCRYVS